MAIDDKGSGKMPRAALLGMGTILRIGTRAMQELIVAHLTEDTTSEDLRLFLRSLHRSGSTARADVVLLFPSSPMPTAMAKVIQEEEESFQKLLKDFETGDTSGDSEGSASTELNFTISPFNAMAFKKAGEENQEIVQEIIWGKRYNLSDSTEETIPVQTSPGSASWGSMVAFDVQELDSQDALHGFLDAPPVQLRRWVCYDMLLGTIKFRYRNVLLSQVKGVYVLGDALSTTRELQIIYITTEDTVWRDARQEPVAEGLSRGPENGSNDVEFLKSTIIDRLIVRKESIRRVLRNSSNLKTSENAEGNDLKESSNEGVTEDPKTTEEPLQTWINAPGLIQSVYGTLMWSNLDESNKQFAVVSAAVIMGEVHYVRGLAMKMTSEIVRMAIEHKSRRLFHDKAVLNMWVHNKATIVKKFAEHMKVVRNKDSVVHSAQGSRQPFVYWRKRNPRSRYLIVHQEDHDGVQELRQELCRLAPTIYKRCL